jgi:hypothetical protein
MSACSSGSPLEPVPPGPASVKTLTFEVWPVTVPEDGPSTYGTRLYLQALNGTVHVDGITLSLGNDPSATGHECGQIASALTLVVGYPKLVDDGSICRANAPVGASAESATLAVSYSDDKNRSDVFRTTVSMPPMVTASAPPPEAEPQGFR